MRRPSPPQRLALALLLGVVGCRRGGDAEGSTAAGTDEAEIVIDEDDSAPALGAPELPSYDTYELAKGDTISEITRKRYGSGHYSRVVLLHNDLRPAQASSLKIGKVIKTPDIDRIYAEEGLMDVVPDGCNALLAARNAFLIAEQELAPSSEEAGDEGADSEPTDRGTRALEIAAAQLDAAIEGFDVDHEQIVNRPRMLMDELREARGLIGKWLDGTSRRKDADEIHKHLGNAAAYAIIWARNDYT